MSAIHNAPVSLHETQHAASGAALVSRSPNIDSRGVAGLTATSAQPTLPLDAPAPRRTRMGCGRNGGQHPNSEAAYREVGARGLNTMQRRVLAIIAGMEPCTDNQLVKAWVANGGEANTPRPRRVELMRMRLIECVGEAGGRSLWRLTAQGRFWLAKGGE